MYVRAIYRNLYNFFKYRKIRVLSIKMLELLNKPIYRIGMDVTNRCNLRCIMCPNSLEQFYNTKHAPMSLELFEKIAKQIFPKTRFIDFSNLFEPFMAPNFLDYLRITRKYCPGHISIPTNGMLMNEKIVEEMINEDLADELQFSIDGTTAKTYNSIRQNADFDTIVSILDKINKEKKAHNKKTPKLRVNYTLLERNIDDLNGVYDFVKKYGIEVLQLRHARLGRDFSNLFNESVFYHKEHFDTVLKKVIKQFSKDKSVTFIHPVLFEDKHSFITDKSGCAYAWTHFSILASGDIKICNVGIIGNLEKQSFKEILNSDRVKQIRRDLLKGKEDIVCSNCYTVSDLIDVQDENSFIQKDAIPDQDLGGFKQAKDKEPVGKK